MQQCPKCGTENKEDSKFCKGCGFNLYKNFFSYLGTYNKSQTLIMCGILIVIIGLIIPDWICIFSKRVSPYLRMYSISLILRLILGGIDFSFLQLYTIPIFIGSILYLFIKYQLKKVSLSVVKLSLYWFSLVGLAISLELLLQWGLFSQDYVISLNSLLFFFGFLCILLGSIKIKSSVNK